MPRGKNGSNPEGGKTTLGEDHFVRGRKKSKAKIHGKYYSRKDLKCLFTYEY